MKDFPDIDALLGELDLSTNSSSSPVISMSSKEQGEIGAPKLIELVQLPEGEIDPRLKYLSHSSRTTLHKCPRKYQLYRLSSQSVALDSIKDTEQGVTFAYGKAVGVGVQSVLEDKSESQVIIDTFLEWDVDLLDETPRQNKSFWKALFAVQKFYKLKQVGYLVDYELVYYEGMPAVELSFSIAMPGDFHYRGFVDAVLRHKDTGEIMVLECKTSSGTAQSAQYKNSGQALGYSVVLDILFPTLSSYTVMYLVYETRSYEYKQLPFGKSLLQRALWLQELLIDCKQVELYESFGSYPMHGESCFDFFRECEYLSLCTLSTENLTKPLTTSIVAEIEEKEGEGKYMFEVTFEELVERQLEMVEE